MLRVYLILLMVSVQALVGACWGAESLFNVDVFFGWERCYRPMEWTPIEIGIGSTLTEPFAGSVIISAQQDGLNRLNITHSFVLTPDVPLHVPLVTKLAFAADSCNVRILDDRGRTRWRQSLQLWDYSSSNRALTAVTENDLLIGLIGQRKFGLFRFPKETACKSDIGSGKIYLKDKLPRMVPWDWTGFVSLDLLVLYDPDWTMLNRSQLNAVAQWVSNGGKLLLVLGSRPLNPQNPIAELLPFEIQPAKQITIETETLANMDLDMSEAETVVCWPLIPKPGSHFCEMKKTDTEECLFAIGYAGFGRVGVLAFDPSTMSDRQKSHSTQFWVSHMAAVLQNTSAKTDIQDPGADKRKKKKPHSTWVYRGLGPNRSIILMEDKEEDSENRVYNQYQFNISQAQAASNVVMEHLYNISEMRPLSIWWVILLLTLLAVLLGPVDYILLKRIDRLPLTWLTSTFWIILFSVGAYYGVRALRGGKMQLRSVSVLDGIENSDCAWSTVYSGLFAPYSADYQLEGTGDKQWWSGIAPTQDRMYYRQQTGSQNIYCFQHDGGNLPYSLPINIWTMQCLLSESKLEEIPVEAEVERRGDEVFVKIVNLSEKRIKKGHVLFDNNQAISFDEVAGQSTEEFSGRLKTHVGWETQVTVSPDGRYRYRSYDRQQSTFENQTAYCAQGSLQRTQTIKAYLAKGAAVVCAEFDQAPVPFSIKDRSCDYNHIQLVRLVVFPK